MATARGYGAPAKAESRYGDGASDWSAEARCAKAEATKNLLADAGGADPSRSLP